MDRWLVPGQPQGTAAGHRAEQLHPVPVHRRLHLRLHPVGGAGRRAGDQQVAERMGITKGRVSQIEQGKVSGQDVIARYAEALGGRLHQAIYFDDGDIAAIA
ncbi:helix-turn-helix domain-containing protein [Paractinoplanes globisporus]|uniref:Helix-turn-helix domain-containing protein n=1 Tax=Paractinoplanes globisporus TaxID=113565 RepID=A0ABW6WWJ3_9ACTN